MDTESITTTIEKEHYSWKEFDQDSTVLAAMVQKKGVQYDTIVAIPRGGLCLGVVLSHKLSLPLVVAAKKSDPYLDSELYNSSTILLVDEISDNGSTFRHWLDYYENIQFLRVDTLAIHKKKNCGFVPTYYIKENTKWQVYPWETE